MIHFGKVKDCGPPTPPRRDDNAQSDWQQDEFECDDDDDMYEVPPCERPINVPQRPKEENVYLERPSKPTVPRRQAPPPRPNFTTQNMKPPAVDRSGKPGMKKKPACIAPSPESEEDVYLDPCEEQDSAEDLYLEPVEACSPPPRGTKMMPQPVLKPPPDRLSSVPGPAFKAVPEVAPRRFSLPKSLPAEKPLPPVNLKERLSTPDPPKLKNKPMGLLETSSGGGNVKTSTANRDWFAGNYNRKMAEELLLSVKRDGAFLIRNSSTQNSRQPYTLAVLYQQKVYNIPVRFLDDTQGYALGKEGKNKEEVFSTLDDMVSHHRNNKLLLIDSMSQAKHTTYLTNAAHP
uniref:Si:dkeyp-117b11.1 n=1 Tax=Neogobius melanostomus TaxID=47308 RepID=A0A8C6SLY4_9GOBI